MAKFAKGMKSMQKMMGGVVGVGLVLLIVTAAMVAAAPKKRNGGGMYKETFVDCGSGFCAPP